MTCRESVTATTVPSVRAGARAPKRNGDRPMMGFLIGWWRARAARPLLWWVIALLAYALLPLPQQLVLPLVIGLGVALTVTVRRLRESGQQAIDTAERAWDIADRLSDALEDRIRHTPQVGYDYGQPAQPQLASVPAAYDPGALVSAVAAILAAEGLPVTPGAALPVCTELLTCLGIAPTPGVSAPTARALVGGLRPGGARTYRAAPHTLLAANIAAVLTADGVLPPRLSDQDAALIGDAAVLILDAFGITPDRRRPVGLDEWPVMADILAAHHEQHGGY